MKLQVAILYCLAEQQTAGFIKKLQVSSKQENVLHAWLVRGSHSPAIRWYSEHFFSRDGAGGE